MCDNCRIAAAAAERTNDELCQRISSAKWIWLWRWCYSCGCVCRTQHLPRIHRPQCDDVDDVNIQLWQAIAINRVCIVHRAFNRCRIHGRTPQPIDRHSARAYGYVFLQPEHRHSDDSAISSRDQRRPTRSTEEVSKTGNHLNARTWSTMKEEEKEEDCGCEFMCKIICWDFVKNLCDRIDYEIKGKLSLSVETAKINRFQFWASFCVTCDFNLRWNTFQKGPRTVFRIGRKHEQHHNFAIQHTKNA